jgi:predicted type IV restriction endonuclease
MPPIEPATAPRAGTLVLRGKSYPYANAKEAMVQVLTMLAESDTTFLQRCSQHPNSQGRKRRYIARTEEELYPDRPDLRVFREALPGGWLVATNLNNGLKKEIIQVAAEVAGLRFGSELSVNF